MRHALKGLAVLLLGTTPAMGGGIERSNQMLGILFEPGNYAELSFGRVRPTVEGTDLPIPGLYPGGAATGDVANSYNQFGLSYKHQFNENWSGAIIIDQPFGADVAYPLDGTPLLAGTAASVDSTHITGIARYVMPETGFGAHAGIRASRADGSVDLRGLAYGAVDGYSVDLDRDTAYGWLAGVSYERPEIAARIALTFNSEIKHDFATTESGPLIDPDGPAGPAPALPLLNGTSQTEVRTPKSVNLEFQTGVAADTLLFGSIRWVDWSSFRVDPERFTAITGDGLVELEDSTTYTLGVGRRFTENWSGSVSASFERRGDDLVSPLAPSTGRRGVTLAAVYTEGPLRVTTGINYTRLGDARPETGTPDTARAEMSGSKALGIGVRVGYSF